jgi:membrane protein
VEETAGQVAHAFSDHEVGVHASAISFRIVLALVPFGLFAMALLGFLDLEEVWRDSIAPELRDRTSPAGFTVIQDTVLHILGRKEAFWLTLGAVIAFWEVSAAIRVSMRAIDRVYGERRPRSAGARYRVSFALTLPVAVCLLGALAAAQLLPPAVDSGGAGIAADVLGRFLGWGLALVLLAIVIALLVRFGPSSPQPFRLVGVASLLVIVSWAITSALFGLYVTSIASYGSVFGGLAFAFILLTYLYLSSIVFLVGIQVDAFLVRSLNRRSD